ncbi:MAG: glycosyl hydrolase, partial [Acidobacteriota bacterium]|nr:glycosyl hydrolase [Acidobacteriota bacterium]
MKRFSEFLNSRALVLLVMAGALVALGAAAGDSPVPQEQLTSKLHWRSVGPYIGGRVVTVTGVPGHNDLFYMGTVGGGIWKSTNYGISWTNISDGTLKSASASIGAIAVADSNPNILYAGTGESDIRGDMITGNGIYKSTDAGKTWNYMGLADTHTISNIVVDPKNPDVVYASSMGHVFVPDPDRGVFKSTDGGKTWKKVLFVDDKTGAINLVMEPSNPDVLYAAMWQAQRTPWSLVSGGPRSGLYKTTDGGAHWTNLTHNEGFPTGVLGRLGVGVAASNPNIVYAIAQAKEGGVFRSEDGGKTWHRVNSQWMLRQRAFYYMAIFVDPKDPNKVYAPNVDALWASNDGGKSWKKLRPPHGDNHVVWINPDNTNILLEGNDGGATVSTDGGKTWSSEHNQPTGQFYHISIDDQYPYHIYGAQQDEGSVDGPSASPGGMIDLGEWDRVAYGESTFVAPQPGSPNITYGSGYFSIFLRYDKITGQYESVSPWPNYQEGSSSGELKNRFGWTHPIIFSPANPKELLISSQYVYRSLDYGRTWDRISPDLTRNDPETQKPSGGPINLDQSGAEIYPDVSSLAVSPLDGKVIWAGSADGLVHVTTDGGANWQAVRPPDLPERCYVSSIEPSHIAAGTAFLSAQRYMWDDFHPYVYETTDYGKHWTSITMGLPLDQFVYVIRQDPSDENLMFIGTRSTVYVSFDAGAHWQPLTLNLPTAQVRDIAINSRQGQVAIATHGRAFWVLDNLAMLEQLTKHPSVESNAAYVFEPEHAWLTHAYGASEFARPGVGQNPPFGATVFFHIPANYDGKTPVKLEFLGPNGQLIRSFTLHLQKKKMTKEQEEAEAATERSPSEVEKAQEEKLTSIEPGMNRFQWDLRYPKATEVKGFWVPVPAGGLPDTVNGPVIVPGRYSVRLDYGGGMTQQSFNVTLDPRLDASTEDLNARLALEQKIHSALDTLNKTINRAIDAREKLEAAVRGHKLTEAQARPAIAALTREIDSVVQLATQSSEGTLLFPTKLRSHLAYLAADIDLAYTKPTDAQYTVFEELDKQAATGEKNLEAAIDAANKVM